MPPPSLAPFAQCWRLSRFFMSDVHLTDIRTPGRHDVIETTRRNLKGSQKVAGVLSIRRSIAKAERKPPESQLRIPHARPLARRRAKIGTFACRPARHENTINQIPKLKNPMSTFAITRPAGRHRSAAQQEPSTRACPPLHDRHTGKSH